MKAMPKGADTVYRRQMELLRRIARAAEYRWDRKLPLRDLAPTLDVKHFAGGIRFVDSSDPKYEGGSELSYDYNQLKSKGYIATDSLRFSQNRFGEMIGEGAAVKVTEDGIAHIRETERSWLARAIEKEPITFVMGTVGVLQLLWTLALAAWTFHSTAGASTPGKPAPQAATRPSQS